MHRKITILGRGMAGINAAPEVIERGFEVAGGKGRGIPAFTNNITFPLEHDPKKLTDFFDIWTSDISDVS